MALKLNTSIDGTIDHLLLCVPKDEASEFAAVYTALIDSLPLQTEITILAQSSARRLVAAWPIDPDIGERITIIDAGDAPMTGWACDLILPGFDPRGEACLLTTPEIDRREDARLPGLLARNSVMKMVKADIPFEGGNILIGEDHIFVGADSPEIAQLDSGNREIVVVDAPDCPEETSHPAMRGDEQWQQIFHYYNKRGTRQPIFHIDMFMTQAGKGADGRERILVGDPAMAAKALDMPLHPHALAAQFDAVAEDLEAQGFTVFRNPLPMIYMDNVEERRRTWFYASSNNVLVQRSGAAGNIIWMAEFGHDNWPELAKTDAANRKIWEDLGYEVRMIADGQRLAENLGGLHCLTNVLKRGGIFP